MLKTMLASGEATMWMPPQASTLAGDIDWLFYFILYWCAFFFVIINGAMFYFMWKYRRRGPRDEVGRITHSTPLEIGWSVLPGFILIFMFWWGFKGFLDHRAIPSDAMTINVVAKQWSWDFIYPNGLSLDELHVPEKTNVRLVMRSDDVLHSLFIAAFRVKQDVVPGRYTDLWFNATRVGEFPLTCAEYCGTSHSDMKARVFVHPKTPDPKQPDPLHLIWTDWLKDADPYSKLTPEQQAEYQKDYEAFLKKYENDLVLGPILKKLARPVERGKQLWSKKGCVGCHTIDGKPHTGPTWKDVYMHDVPLSDGTIVKGDENYLRESILEPNKKKVRGFEGQTMPPTNLRDYEIDSVIAFIKSLSETKTDEKK